MKLADRLDRSYLYDILNKIIGSVYRSYQGGYGKQLARLCTYILYRIYLSFTVNLCNQLDIHSIINESIGKL